MLTLIPIIVNQRLFFHKSLLDCFKSFEIERRHACKEVQKSTPNLPQHGVEQLWMDVAGWLLEHRPKHIVVLRRLHFFYLLSHKNFVAPDLFFDSLHFSLLLIPKFHFVSISKPTNSNFYFLWGFVYNDNIVRTHINMHNLILDEIVSSFNHLSNY